MRFQADVRAVQLHACAERFEFGGYFLASAFITAFRLCLTVSMPSQGSARCRLSRARAVCRLNCAPLFKRVSSL